MVKFRSVAGICCMVLMAVTGASAVEPVFELSGDTEVPLVSTAAGFYLIGYLVDRSYEPLTAEMIEALDPAKVNGLDRTAIDNWSPGAARASDYFVLGSVIAPLGLLLTDAAGGQADVLGVMYVETMALSTGVTYLLKNAFGRTRPYVYSDNPEIPLGLKMSRTSRRSFPSGHTATAFAAMVFTATVNARLNPDSSANGWVWGGCLAAAATTGYLRYTAGKHFPTDILAGATIGAAAGWVVPQLHEVSPRPGDPQQSAGRPGQMVFGVTLGF